MVSEEAMFDPVYEERFKEFLSSQVEKLPVKRVEDYLVWEEPRHPPDQALTVQETVQVPLYTVFAEQEIQESLNISKAEAELIRRQIRELDMKMGSLTLWNKVLKIAVITLFCIITALIITRYIKAW